MALRITIDFLNDLRESGDHRFVRQVLNHTIADDCTLKPDRNDHRYDGVADAWIRYVTRGTSAFRVIYLKKGADVYLYRAGPHSVEDHLSPPTTLAQSVLVGNPGTVQAIAANVIDGPVLLKTTEPKYLPKHLTSMYHYKHKEIYIVAPYIEMGLLDRRHRFGQFLDKAVEEGTVVAVITTPPDRSELPAFQDLEKREMFVFFLERLHTKLYLFEMDVSYADQWQRPQKCLIVVGSSNFTYRGLGIDDYQPTNEELCCALPASMLDEIKQYTTKLTTRADDYNKYSHRLARSPRP